MNTEYHDLYSKQWKTEEQVISENGEMHTNEKLTEIGKWEYWYKMKHNRRIHNHLEKFGI